MDRMRMQVAVWALGCVVAMLMPCPTVAKVAISGTTGEYVSKEMTLFECRDGIPLPVATTEVDGIGAFSLSAEIPGTGFYLLGCTGGVRHVLYLKGARVHAWFFRTTGGCESVEVEEFEREMASLKALAAWTAQQLKGQPAAAKDFAPLMRLKMDADQAFLRMAYQRTHLGETDDSFVAASFWQHADPLFQQKELLQLPFTPEMMGVYVDCKAARVLPPAENPAIISGSEYQARAGLIADKGLRQSYILEVASHLRYYEMYSQLCDTFAGESFSERMLQALQPIGESLEWSKPGGDAPDFKGQKTDDEWLSLSDLRGKVVVIDVWATWCVPCLRMMPYFRQLEKELSDPDVAFLSVCVGALPEKDLWLKLVKENQLSGNVVFIDSWVRGFAKDYKVTSVPRFMIIDRQGKVFSYAAPAPKYPQLKQLILKALKN